MLSVLHVHLKKMWAVQFENSGFFACQLSQPGLLYISLQNICLVDLSVFKECVLKSSICRYIYFPLISVGLLCFLSFFEAVLLNAYKFISVESFQ